MSDKLQHPLTDVLSSALAADWGKLSETTRESVRAAVADIITHLNLGDAVMSEFEKQPLPEARRTDWLVVYNEDARVEISCTFRSNSDTDVEARIDAFLARRGIKLGPVWTSLDTKIVNRKEAYNNAQQQPVTVAQPVAMPAAQGGDTSGVFICNAKELLALPKSDSDNTLMWKVMTDKSKYPVALYEEAAKELAPVLAASNIDVNNFVLNGQPAKYNLTGWKAHYVLKDDGKYPKKIVNLTK